MNSVIFIGRLTKDVETRQTTTGNSIASFYVAVDRGKDRDGNDLGADFPRVVVWGKTAENMARYVGKGCRVAVTGRIRTGKYQKQNGETVYTTDVYADRVEFIDFRDDNRQDAGRDDSIPDSFEALDENVPY
jgi:single-strand DNA-binding protein